MKAYKFVAAYSGVLNEAAVQENYAGDKYRAIDAVIGLTQGEFERQKENISSGLYVASQGKTDAKVMNLFNGRWGFMKDTLEGLAKNIGGA
jgi:hypothetical protein